jgi:hypothetical protein
MQQFGRGEASANLKVTAAAVSASRKTEPADTYVHIHMVVRGTYSDLLFGEAARFYVVVSVNVPGH